MEALNKILQQFHTESERNQMLCNLKMSKITSPVQREEVQGSSPPINMYVLYI
jgi:hypothetical protein